MSVLSANDLLVPRLHTFGVNQGTLWAHVLEEITEFQPMIISDLTMREALQAAVYGNLWVGRDNNYCEWELKKWDSFTMGPWMHNRNQGQWHSKY